MFISPFAAHIRGLAFICCSAPGWRQRSFRSPARRRATRLTIRWNKGKRAYYMLDAPRMTMRMGLAMSPPRRFEVDVAAANKAAIAAERDGKGLSFATAVSDARWGEGKDISSLDVLVACADVAGWKSDAVRAAQNDPSIDEAFASHRALIEQDNVFGVPFAVLGDAKYWGHDRFSLLIEDAQAAP